MIEKHVRMAREIVTGDEARWILEIETWYDTVEETLFNLGLPPNRNKGQQGFLVDDTDGRVSKAAATALSDPRLVL